MAITAVGLVACSPSQPTAAPTATAGATPSSVPTPEPSHDFKPGAAGIGDPYFPAYGNGGYDVASYGIKVKYDPKTDKLSGDVTITAAATQDLSGFNLDLAGLSVRSVTVDDVAATVRRQANELIVTPAKGIASGGTFVTHVVYDGVPKPVKNKYKDLGEGGWFATADGAIVLGQPDSAAGWFPVNDHPLDKAVYTIEATVPKGLTAVSNGVLGTTTTTGAWTTWTWSESKPMASYLSTLVIGKFRVTTGTHNGKPVYSAVTTKIAKGAADTSVAHTVKIADFLETQFGPYPFDSYGGVVISDDRIHFALETQSRPVYSAGFFRNGVNDTVIAHELAHQWFGDAIAVHHWEDIWLNEGFARYAEWLWNDHAGVQSAQKSFNLTYQRSTPDVWKTPPGRPGAAHIFDATVYDRGAMTLHALRKAVGDRAFFAIVKAWTTEKTGGNGTTAEFVALAEKESGKQLDSLFDAWLYGKTKPKL
ncbi:M1 family metallopeptidase [Catellatospora tritici]|uniref:M1 family metallopeptidase n=1 Tax=Catellatospora tritici TaxID=2851566 RepID=UPI001C2DCB84|nr:M1 family metallopeptidase [Catellatospora tritici]MBV1856419.1 M1 family metallopeptidase [Catellatospora tritici]